MTNVSRDFYGEEDIAMATTSAFGVRSRKTLAGELPEEFLLIHVILEGLAAIDEHDRNFIIKLAAEFVVGIDIDFVPGKSSAAGEFVKTLLHHFAKVASFARIYDDVTRIWHAGRILAREMDGFQSKGNKDPQYRYGVPSRQMAIVGR